jgi:signal peptidase I
MAFSVLAIPLFQLAAGIDAARHAAQSPAAGGSPDLFMIGTVIWLAALATFAGLLYAVTSLNSIVVGDDDMAPTLLQGDRLATWKDYYRDRLPERGDVAVVLLPGMTEPRAMRILGLPGDSLLSVLGALTVNGEAIGRERLGDFSWRDAAGTHRNAARWRETLPGGAAYEILQSAEGMFGGTLLGASLRIPDGSYFVIGDNRDDTQSSWDFGFLPGEVLSDRPTVILGSSDRSHIGRSVQP